MTFPEIPDYIWARRISSIAVEYWHSHNELRQRIQAVLPDGWFYYSHHICEYDSFGPVTSELTLRHSNGTVYKGLI